MSSYRSKNSWQLIVGCALSVWIAGCASGVGAPGAPAGTGASLGLGSLGSLVDRSAPSKEIDAPKAPSATQEEDAKKALLTSLAQLQAEHIGAAYIPAAQDYLNGLLTLIQKKAAQPPVPARVVIWPRKLHNADTQPDGLIIVDLGWLTSKTSEAELTALLAHEYAHLLKGHLVGKGRVGAVVYAAQKIVGTQIDQVNVGSMLLSAGVTTAWTNVFAPHWSSGQELEADEFALETTKKLDVSYTQGVKKFLETIQSDEKHSVVVPPQSTSAAAEDHPSIGDRIAKLKALNGDNKPTRSSMTGKDPLLAIVNAPEFKAKVAEYYVLDQIYRPQGISEADILKNFQKLPRPYLTSAAMSLGATRERKTDDTIKMMNAAIAAPDATFDTYLELAKIQRDTLGNAELAFGTLAAGLERVQFGNPALPPALKFTLDTSEGIRKLPDAQRTLPLQLLQIKLAAYLVAVRTRCVMAPNFDLACTEASMTAEAKQQQKDRDAKNQKRFEQEAKSKFDSAFGIK
jgi:Zn-dependent protease with chaperone function